MTRLISVGNVIVDMVVRVPSLPERGGDVLGIDGGSAPGGSANTLVAAARQGLTSVYAGGHGTGPNGDLVRALFDREAITLCRSRSSREDTGFDIALIDADGERTFVTVFGAEASLTDMHGVEVAAGDLLHVSGYGLLERTNASVLAPWLAEVAEGVVMLLDPGPLCGDIHPGVLARLKSRVDWFSCNLREARLLTGQVDAAAAATALAGEWRSVVVRLGAEGCLVVHGVQLAPAEQAGHAVRFAPAEQPGHAVRFAPAEQPGDVVRVIAVPGFAATVVDTNGAGDAHVGAFLAALAAGHPPLVAARRANACAAIAVGRPGPISAPTTVEVDALLAGRPA
jgi:sugar/nucleoside kinase (ribokinase family)